MSANGYVAWIVAAEAGPPSFGWRPLGCARTDSELGVSPADRANALYGPSIRYRRWDDLDDDERLIADIAQGCFQRSRPEIFRRNQKNRRFKAGGLQFSGGSRTAFAAIMQHFAKFASESEEG